MVVIRILGVREGIHRQVVALSRKLCTGLVQLDQDSLASQTQPTTDTESDPRWGFSIRAGVGRVWLVRLWIRSSGHIKEVAAYNSD